MTDTISGKARELLAALYEAQGNKAAAFTVRSVGAVGTVLETQLSLITAALQGQEGVREVPFEIEFSRAYIAGALEDEHPEIRRHWKRLNDFLSAAYETSRAALSADPAPEEWTRDLTPEEQKMIDRAWERHKAAGPIDLDELATRFCSAPLPDTVCADPCASMPGYPNRTGTNLLTVAEAREVLARVLADPAPEGES